ncbi:Coenzyme F420 hydrogenase/dehydrogenase, beta subunit C-terminal domain [Desulfobacula toluolica]|uniref:Uncharacterized 4Fe-4S cluster protein n=1 Tax=Desulfobacula toluolica (strain DSM 7467 / Tol2) TaxID=651182 RepID=K0NDM3_DESTT|nr:Coenzyme F420 hydrogenase/dehydrogenase, beta subunit C-terminal domain [Desulfobacula toluolica]CCK78986.1 uncharacterized 4Fe-4S cluster protein [Desulfobacula toluolica Tol2]
MIVQQMESCSGCSACESICPNDAIDMKENKEGFLYPSINAEKCDQCGICEDICPVLSSNWRLPRNETPLIYAAWNNDAKIRRLSSSGGVFTDLAIGTLEIGGVVFGAGFNEDAEVTHKAVGDVNSLEDLRGSKYVQSRIGDTYEQVQELLNEKKQVLFSGTPCQIAGLYAFLGRDDENLYTCDFICHGVPSPKVYQKYLAYMENKYNSKVKHVSFRDKRFGWIRPVVVVDFEEGGQKWEFSQDNPYFFGFVKNIFLRRACYVCSFKGIPRVSDITLADFWGIGEREPGLDNDKGTSLVLVNSEKGQMLWEKCRSSLFSKKCPAEYLNGNSTLFGSVPANNKRDFFFRDLDRFGFEAIIDKYMKPRNKIRQWMSLLKALMIRTINGILKNQL